MRKYTPIKFKDTVAITQFYTVEYYESSNLFDLEMDCHDFWELSYIDSGTIYCNRNGEHLELHKGDLLLIPPNCVHQYLHKDGESATVLFLCFSSSSPLLKTLVGQHAITSETKDILYKIISEIRSTFTFTFNTDIRIIDKPRLGGQQMTKIYLTELLIVLARQQNPSFSKKELFYVDTTDNEIVNKILTHLKNHLYGTLTLEDLSNRLFYSKSYLNRIFKKHMNYTIKEHYNYLKIKEAKKLLHSNPKQTINEISNLLQYDSLSYFIKVFKKYTGVTPMEYKERFLLE